MINPRWKKVFSDLIGNPTRTFLVVLSIFVGVFAVGLIVSSQAILGRELRANYLATNPANATIATPSEDSFDQDLVDVIRSMHGVQDAEARRSFAVRARIGRGEWHQLTLIAIDDYHDMRVNIIRPVRGAWPPDDKEVLVERSGLSYLHTDIGATLTVELPDGKQRDLRIAGVAHDIGSFPTIFTGIIIAFVNFDTMEWLGESRDFNQVSILVAGDNTNQEHNRAVAETVYDKIEKSGRDPAFPDVPEPGKHPSDTLISGLVLLMGVLGVLSIFLSGFLVTNTISALLAQQTRQIGVMKAIGARGYQIFCMYMVLVLGFGIIAMALGVPLSQMGTRAFTGYLASLLNFDLMNFSVPTYVYLIQGMVSLVVPVLAALFPVLKGVRISVREAISSEGGPGRFGTSLFDRMIQRIRGLPRPLLLSLRNTFRRKGRVTLTLMTLTLGGAIFISVLSVQDSLRRTVDDVFDRLYNYDVGIGFDRTYRMDYVLAEASKIPGVTSVESRFQTMVRRRYADDSESLGIILDAVRPDTVTIQPRLAQGRWLLPTDQNALVISSGVLDQDPDIKVGDEIVLMIKGRETTWQVVGVMPTIGDSRDAFASYDYYTEVARDVGTTDSLWIMTDVRSAAFQARVAHDVEEHFKRLGMTVTYNQTSMDFRDQINAQFGFIVISLAVMAALVAVVGGLGLAGTMSLNVLERTREIGMMRAIGATDWTVLQIVLVEGILLGLMSWCLGAALAFPISWALSEAVGQILFRLSLNFSFSLTGLGLWLAIALGLATLASFWPAWNASRLTVRDVLAYE